MDYSILYFIVIEAKDLIISRFRYYFRFLYNNKVG
jgi:hypothetical protein